MALLPAPSGDAMPWLVRKLRPALLAAFLSALLCSGAVIAALSLFLVSQTIMENGH